MLYVLYIIKNSDLFLLKKNLKTYRFTLCYTVKKLVLILKAAKIISYYVNQLFFFMNDTNIMCVGYKWHQKAEILI